MVIAAVAIVWSGRGLGLFCGRSAGGGLLICMRATHSVSSTHNVRYRLGQASQHTTQEGLSIARCRQHPPCQHMTGHPPHGHVHKRCQTTQYVVWLNRKISLFWIQSNFVFHAITKLILHIILLHNCYGIRKLYIYVHPVGENVSLTTLIYAKS